MDGGIDFDTPLDYAAFQISVTKNRYDAFVCGDKTVEKLASGLLEQLVLHLPEAKDAHSKGTVENFKLQLPENLRDSPWFTKSILLRFLHIVGAPVLLEAANAIEDEMSQLEEARRFHLSLYTQGHQDHSRNSETDSSNLEGSELTTKLQTQTTSSDATKNELLRAMDLRLAVLSQELLSAFSQAADATCSTKHIADLAAFAEHFGAVDLRNSLFKCLILSQKNHTTASQHEQSTSSLASVSNGEISTDGIAQMCSPLNKDKPVMCGVSPAKVAQVERQSSSESEKSLNSTDEDQPSLERSRPLIRSASPRRSASPMRRIQIGRSGSRRAAALTIKSLNYFPARERVPSVRDAMANSSEEEESDRPQKKPESSIRRMSVQDAINLFESKQRDQNSNLQKRRASSEVSIATNKSVLRRWSAGMGDPLTQCPSENTSASPNQMTSNNLVVGEIQDSSMGPKPESDSSSDHVKAAEVGAPFESGENRTSDPSDNLQDNVIDLAEETHDMVTASAEWNRQKEAELNQMMMKMMERKPASNQKMETGNGRTLELPTDLRDGFYDHYKEKQNEKLRCENTGKIADKEPQLKSMQEVLDKRKVAMASKNVGAAVKKDSLSKPRQSQKNSSPSMQPKKENSKPANSRKTLPIASSLPVTRKSWPTTPSTKTTRTTSTKTANEFSSAGTTPTRRKHQPAPSPDQPSPKVGRSHQQQKNVKGNRTENKQLLKASEELKQQAARKSGKTAKMRVLPSGDDTGGVAQEKPSFYSKMNKRSSVVPLESKPYLRKGSGTGRGVGSTTIKTKASQLDESSRNTGNVIQAQEEVVSVSAKQHQEGDMIPLVSIDANFNAEALVNSQQECGKTENADQFVAESIDSPEKTSELPVEIQADEESGISSIAWVEMEDQKVLPVSSNSSPPQNELPANVAPVALSSPRVRHSLSQMLQEDSGEPEIMEWGNAENPPAMIYQKDAPKGLKRLLKFARKSRGEANVTGWSSPSVFSEGEEDAEEPKVARRNADTLLKKAAIQAKGFGKQKDTVTETCDGRKSTGHELLSAQSHRGKLIPQCSHKLQESHISAAATSTKATRSFFSLSTFRSGKSNETKLH
ncbi:COP1-interacting protein 7-like isoform X2 [Macadamia integrifolia]|nr:COP1-interacting protein 7-like isoform X2 [Macadamia integrifolia]XP_042475974.1 COP1-interacting protein 7-like isoform X2 [Macadamia integrifolia]